MNDDYATGLPMAAFKQAGESLKDSGLAMPGYGQIFFNAKDGTAWYVGGDGDEKGFSKRVESELRDITEVKKVVYESESFPPDGAGYVQVYPKYRNKALDQVPGGKGDNRPDSDFDADALAAGVKVEMEHTDDAELAKEIAKDHLTEDAQYYEKLAMVHKSIRKGTLYRTDDDEMSATFVLSTGAEDRDGETVNPEGGDFDDYAKNPVVAFNHNTDDFPIGTSGGSDGKVAIWVDTVEVDGDRKPALLGKCFFSKANPKGQLAYEMVKEGTLRGCSISFLPLGSVGKNNRGGNHYENWKLLEWSICPIGSNADAVKLSKKLKALTKGYVIEHRGRYWTGDGWDVAGRAHYFASQAAAEDAVVRNDSIPTDIHIMRWGKTAMKFFTKTLSNGKKSLWVCKSAEGPLDEETQAHIEEMGLDEVRIEDSEPEEGDGYVEEKAAPGGAYWSKLEPRQTSTGKWEIVDQNGKYVFGPYYTKEEAKRVISRHIHEGHVGHVAGKSLDDTVSDLEERIEQEVPKVVKTLTAKWDAAQSMYLLPEKEAWSEDGNTWHDDYGGTPRIGDNVKLVGGPKNGQTVRAKAIDDEIIERCGDMMKSDGIDEELVERAKRLVKRKKFTKNGSEPAGYRALNRWLKAIEEEVADIEQRDVQKAAESACKIFKQAMKRAYKELATDISSEEVEEVEKSYAWYAMSDGSNKPLQGPFKDRVAVMAWIKQNEADAHPGMEYYEEGNEPAEYEQGRKKRASVSKRLSKAKRAELKEMADFLEDAANADDTPKRLSAGMKHFFTKCKDLMGDDEIAEKNEDDLTDDDLEELSKEMAELTESGSMLTEKLFRVSGRRCM